MNRPRPARRTARRDVSVDPAEVLHIAEAPPSSPRVDVGRLRDHVDQLALVDAGSGAWDLEALEALDGPMPREAEIDRMVDRLAAEAGQGLREVRTAGRHRIEHARHRTPGSDGVVRSQTALQRQIEELAQAVERVGSQRERAGHVLRGEVDEDGVRWTDAEPPEPTATSRVALLLRAEMRRHALFSWVAPTFAAVAEGVICWDLMHGELRAEDPWRPLAYSLPLVFFLALLPHLLGLQVATARRAESWRRPAVTALALAVLWIGALLVIAHERNTLIRDAARSRIAAQHTVSPDQVSVSLLGSSSWQLGLWLAVLVGVGVSLIALQITHHNPVVGQALRHDTALALLRPRLRRTRAELELVTSAVSVQMLAYAEHETGWRQFIDATLPALRSELRARYRAQLSCAFASPDVTTAVATTPTTPVTAQMRGVVLPTQVRPIDLTAAEDRHENGKSL